MSSVGAEKLPPRGLPSVRSIISASKGKLLSTTSAGAGYLMPTRALVLPCQV